LFLPGGAKATVWVLNATDKTIIIKLSFRQDKNLHLEQGHINAHTDRWRHCDRRATR
jgi:hypothetical protein